jgi:hypothetical protein
LSSPSTTSTDTMSTSRRPARSDRH